MEVIASDCSVSQMTTVIAHVVCKMLPSSEKRVAVSSIVFGTELRPPEKPLTVAYGA